MTDVALVAALGLSLAGNAISWTLLYALWLRMDSAERREALRDGGLL